MNKNPTVKKDWLITTACNSSYFTHCINLILSIRRNFSSDIKIYVFDLGLNLCDKAILYFMKNVEIKNIPNYYPNIYDFYSWKFSCWSSDTNVILHLDSASVVVKNLYSVFLQIEEKGYMLFSQGKKLGEILPSNFNYFSNFSFKNLLESEVFAAGIIGLNLGNENIKTIILQAQKLAKSGACIGCSRNETQRFKHINYFFPIYDCKYFRHDQTVLNCLFYKNLKEFKIYPEYLVAHNRLDLRPDSIVWASRKNSQALYELQNSNNIVFKYLHLQYIIKEKISILKNIAKSALKKLSTRSLF